MVEPLVFVARLRAIISLAEERELDLPFEEYSREMYRRVAESLPDMSIAAVMERWAQEISALSLAEQRRAGEQKLAVLEELGFKDAEQLVDAALAQAERLGDQALLAALSQSRPRKRRHVA
jgi:hypothetical protein